MDFEIFEHTADQGIRACGNSLSEVFINAARAFASLSTDPEKVIPQEEFRVEISRDEIDELLVAWLNELIFIQETEGVFLIKFEIDTLEPPLLRARVWGEKINREKHTLKSCVKAATYHGLKLEHIGDTWQGQVIFDV
jgi:SHS2 domain-containing protein